MQVSEYTTEEWHQLLTTHPSPPYSLPRLLKSMKSGIPDSLRPFIWQFLTTSLPNPSLYSKLQLSPDPTISDLIQKDISRTFPSHPRLNQKSLLNLLQAYSQFDIQVGYCQGMSFVAGTLLLTIPDEEAAFWAFVFIMFDKNWREVYLPTTPKLNTLLLALQRKIQINLPLTFKHFAENDVEMIMLSQHFITILAYKVKLRFSVRIMDVFLCCGEEVIVQVLFNMIKLKEKKILNLTGEFLFRFLLERMLEECYEEFHVTMLLEEVLGLGFS